MSMRTHTRHLIGESRRELGMKELEGLASCGPRKLAGTGDFAQGNRKGRLTDGWRRGSTPERRGRAPDIEKIGMEELPRTLAGYIGMNLHQPAA